MIVVICRNYHISVLQILLTSQYFLLAISFSISLILGGSSCKGYLEIAVAASKNYFLAGFIVPFTLTRVTSLPQITFP